MEARSSTKAVVSTLDIGLFGTFTVRVSGEPLPPLRSRKGQWLLTLLVLRRDQSVDRNWLAGTLWPESDESAALYSLRRSLNDLRQALGDSAYRLQGPTARTLRLDLQGATVDLLAFDAAIAERDDASLRRAVALYTGPLLENCLESWILPERGSREHAYLQALETLAAHARLADDPREAARLLRLAVECDPLRETAQRALMEALDAGGDTAGAIQVYRAFRLLLHQELQAAPSPETVAAYQRFKQNTTSGPPPNSPSLRAMPAPTPSQTTGPCRVPQPLTRIVGQQRQMEEIEGFLAQGRLVSLTGMGGVGKTRLATQVSLNVTERFLGGVWFIDLAAVSDPMHVARAIATTLEVREEPGSPPTAALAAFLNGPSEAPRAPTLLVLDNCEHVMRLCAMTVDALLRSCPRLYIITTSRQALGLTGEIVCRIATLAAPDPRSLAAHSNALLEQLRAYPAIELFVERARMVRPGFALNAQNARTIATICRNLDGLPLAIELAAARIRSLSPEAISAHLDDRFRLLTGTNATALPHRQTLRALVDWSYHLLTQPQQTLLRRLSVFSAGWTWQAAQAVCRGEGVADWEVLDLLTDLVDRSLVGYTEVEGEGRYTLLDAIRQYSRAQLLEAEPEAPLRQQHLVYYTELAREANAHLSGEDQGAWLERLAREHDNFRAALWWAGATEESGVIGLELAGSLARFWAVRGHWKEGREHLERLLASRAGTAASRARAYNGAGALSWNQGDYTAARAHYEQSLEAWKQLNDPRSVAVALANLGVLAYRQQDFAAARLLEEESLTIRRELQDEEGIANSLTNLGLIAWNQGDSPYAILRYSESLAIRRQRGDRRGIATCLTNLGLVACDQGDYPRASVLYRESEAIFRALGDLQALAETLQSIADVAFRQHQEAAAEDALQESILLFQRLGQPYGLVAALQLLIRLTERRRATDRMAKASRELVELSVSLEHTDGLIDGLEGLARALVTHDALSAVRLLAVAETLRAVHERPRNAEQEEVIQQQKSAVRAELGASLYETLWEKSRHITPREALATIVDRVALAASPL